MINDLLLVSISQMRIWGIQEALRTALTMYLNTMVFSRLYEGDSP